MEIGMVATPSPDDTPRYLRWLRHGSELAQQFYGDRSSHKLALWSLLGDAADVMRRLPDQEKSWLSAGSRAGGINPIGLSSHEAFMLERMRYLNGMRASDAEPRFNLSRDDECRSFDVMCWLNWCNDSRDAQALKKAAVKLAGGAHPRDVHRFYAPHRPFTYHIAQEVKNRVSKAVLSGLKHCGIEPVGRYSFSEIGELQAA